MKYLTAQRAVVNYSNGKKVQLDHPKSESLFFKVRENRESKNSVRLERLGGRNEFEILRQKKIVDWLQSAERPDRKKVLIIGDSIRMRLTDTTGYGIHAYQHLIEDFNLVHLPHNSGSTTKVLSYLENWLSCQPNIVHINAGLHDLALYSTGEFPGGYSSIVQYVSNLDKIITTIKESDVSTIIWASNTPVQEEWHRYKPGTQEDKKLIRSLKDVVEYNQAAQTVMKKHGVETNDLFEAVMQAGLEDCLIADGVHLSHTGSSLLGKIVAEQILKFK